MEVNRPAPNAAGQAQEAGKTAPVQGPETAAVEGPTGAQPPATDGVEGGQTRAADLEDPNLVAARTGQLSAEVKAKLEALRVDLGPGAQAALGDVDITLAEGAIFDGGAVLLAVAETEVSEALADALPDVLDGIDVGLRRSASGFSFKGLARETQAKIDAAAASIAETIGNVPPGTLELPKRAQETVAQQTEAIVQSVAGEIPIDVNLLVQWVLRQSYQETTKELRYYAEKVQFYNELKKSIRAESARAREFLPDGDGLPTTGKTFATNPEFGPEGASGTVSGISENSAADGAESSGSTGGPAGAASVQALEQTHAELLASGPQEGQTWGAWYADLHRLERDLHSQDPVASARAQYRNKERQLRLQKQEGPKAGESRTAYEARIDKLEGEVTDLRHRGFSEDVVTAASGTDEFGLAKAGGTGTRTEAYQVEVQDGATGQRRTETRYRTVRGPALGEEPLGTALRPGQTRGGTSDRIYNKDGPLDTINKGIDDGSLRGPWVQASTPNAVTTEELVAQAPESAAELLQWYDGLSPAEKAAVDQYWQENGLTIRVSVFDTKGHYHLFQHEQTFHLEPGQDITDFVNASYGTVARAVGARADAGNKNGFHAAAVVYETIPIEFETTTRDISPEESTAALTAGRQSAPPVGGDSSTPASNDTLPGSEEVPSFKGQPLYTEGKTISTKQELENYIADLEDLLATAGEDGQLANVDLQNILQRQQQTLQQMSNISKQLHDTALAIIRKIGG